jgi:hypothetical protein
MSDSTSEHSASPWLHIGDCPVCGDGLCRVRCCTGTDGQKHLYALCDECETIWLQPNTQSQRLVPDSDNPRCPFSAEDLYGPHSRWATTEDIRGTPWETETIVELPMTLGDDPEDKSPETPFVTHEDFASPLDIPTLTQPELEHDSSSLQPYRDDWAYGQDEPRPGC